MSDYKLNYYYTYRGYI